MGADDAGTTRSQRMRLEELAARLVLAHRFYPEDAVRLAAQLLAEGVDGDGLVELASQPADSTAIDGSEVERLFRTALTELGVAVPSREDAAWTLARSFATAIVAGEIPPADGALRISNVARACGHPGELAEILAFAPEVIAAADRRA